MSWPLTLNNNKHLPLIMSINCTKLKHPGAFGSACILPTMYPVTFFYYVTIRFDLLHPTLKNNRHLSLIMLINCIKLYDPGAFGSVCILPTTFSYYVTIRLWPKTSDFKNKRHLPLIMLIKCSRTSRFGLQGPDRQTDRRMTLYHNHPVKDGRIKTSVIIYYIIENVIWNCIWVYFKLDF